MSRPIKLDGQVLQSLVSHIRRGAYDWVAAETAAISRRTFYRWLARGQQGEAPIAAFAAAVHQARAAARAEAEEWVFANNRLAWLRLGPGRERHGELGWTSPIRSPVEAAPDEEPDDEEASLFATIETALHEAGWADEVIDSYAPAPPLPLGPPATPTLSHSPAPTLSRPTPNRAARRKASRRARRKRAKRAA
jgi:hypothetical protein